MIADVEHEIPVWFAVTAASAAEQPVLSAGVDGLFAAAPALADRCADFCADRGLDGGPLERKLWDAYRVRPLVDVREMWREEKREPGYDAAQPILRSPAADGGSNVLHSEKGEVSCRCPATGEVRPMAFQGFEADRGTLKCRCPAAAYGLDCSFGFECHFVRGGAKMTTRLGLAVAVMMALALGAVLARISHQAACRRQEAHGFQEVGRDVDDRADCGLRWPRPPALRAGDPRGSFGPVRARAPSTVVPAMLSVASTRTGPKSSATITAPGEKCGLAGRPERMRSLVDPGLPLAA